MNALKLFTVVLAVACSAAAAQTATTAPAPSVRPIDSSLSGVSLLELVNEAKAAVASNPDLAALFASVGDVSKLTEAELTALVSKILVLTDSSSSRDATPTPVVTAAGAASDAPAPIVTPKNAANARAMASAAAFALVASVAVTLL